MLNVEFLSLVWILTFDLRASQNFGARIFPNTFNHIELESCGYSVRLEQWFSKWSISTPRG